MKRIVTLISLITLVSWLYIDAMGQERKTKPTRQETNTEKTQTTKKKKPTDRESLENILDFFPVPPAEIPVLENALGDMNQDSVLSILDLLRIRDIAIGRPPAPTSYEMLEGDLNDDTYIDNSDVSIMTNILLFKELVPHRIGPGGGIVNTNNVNIIVPPGALDSIAIMRVRQLNESEFAAKFGVDTQGALQDSVYFMSHFELITNTQDFKLPIDFEIKLDSVPQCGFRGLNGLFAAVPDQDGDGKSELFLINSLEVIEPQTENDSLYILKNSAISKPLIANISANASKPGEPIYVEGSNFGTELKSTILKFMEIGSDSLALRYATRIEDTSLYYFTPLLNPGQYYFYIKNLLTGLHSDTMLITILPPDPFIGDLRSFFINYYDSIKQKIDTTIADSITQYLQYGGNTDINAYLKYTIGEEINVLDSLENYYGVVPDSILNTYNYYASYLQNTGINKGSIYYESYRNSDPCDALRKKLQFYESLLNHHVEEYYKAEANCIESPIFPCSKQCEYAASIINSTLLVTQTIAALKNALNDCRCRVNKNSCNKCEKTVFIGMGPGGKGVFGSFGGGGGGSGGGGLGTNGCCVNIINYEDNDCEVTINYITVEAPIPPEFPYPCNNNDISIFGETPNYVSPHVGSIMKVTNASVPYNIVGVLNNVGRAFIPHIPLNIYATISLYDPVTGLYDPDISTYLTSSIPGNFSRPLGLFQPNTEVSFFPLTIGNIVSDSITFDRQRVQYLLNINQQQLGLITILGFRSGVPLSIKLWDPSDSLLIDNINTNCYFENPIIFDTAGTYKIQIAFGSSGQEGSFTLGLSSSPYPPIPYLCGQIPYDTLYTGYSYINADPAIVQANDTLIVQEGIEIQFESGGSITGGGVLQGIGTSGNPIILKPSGGQNKFLSFENLPVDAKSEEGEK